MEDEVEGIGVFVPWNGIKYTNESSIDRIWLEPSVERSISNVSKVFQRQPVEASRRARKVAGVRRVPERDRSKREVETHVLKREIRFSDLQGMMGFSPGVRASRSKHARKKPLRKKEGKNYIKEKYVTKNKSGACDPELKEMGVRNQWKGSEVVIPETMGPKEILAPLIVSGHKCFALVDSGSSTSAIDIELAKEYGLNLRPTQRYTRNFTGEVERIEFETDLEFYYGTQKYTHNVDVCSLTHSVYIGLDLFPKLGIEMRNVAVEFYKGPGKAVDPHLEAAQKLLSEQEADAIREGTEHFLYPEEYYDMEKEGANAYLSSLWKPTHAIAAEEQAKLEKAIANQKARNEAIPLGEFCNDPDSRITIQTQKGVLPQHQKQYKLDPKVHEAVTQQVEKWKEFAIIEPAPFRSPWGSPIIGVSKKDAVTGERTDIRTCIDFRKVNNILEETYIDNVPLVSDLYQKVEGKKYFSALDLKWSYHQFEVAPEDRVKTAFEWEGKRWMFKGAPFGIKHLTSRMQLLMSKILQDCYGFTIVFVDDIIICSNTLEEHIEHVRIVLDILTKVNLKLNLEKCHFGFQCIQALGHLITGDSRHPEPNKLAKMQSWVKPTTGKQVMSFLGFTNYLRDYIPLYSSIVAPLEPLRKKKHIDVEDWTEECQEAFDSLKRILALPPVIQPALKGHKLFVACDASQYGVGAVLYQIVPDQDAEGGERKRYIQFASRALNTGQRNYSATRRELLAIIFALQRFRFHLADVKFELLTDHRALTFMFSQTQVNFMLANWLDVLLDYDFTITHCPGVMNVLPDALSRQYPSYVAERSAQSVHISKEGVSATEVSTECETRSCEVEGCQQQDCTHTHGGEELSNSVRASKVDEWINCPDKELKTFVRDRLGKLSPDKEKRKDLIAKYHRASGHESGEATFKKLWYDGFYWPKMKAQCSQASLGCLACLRWNVGKTGFHPMKAITAERPFAHIAIDLADFTHMTSVEGHRYMLVMVDVFSKFTFLRPLKDKTAYTIARELFDISNIVGPYKILQSDNGTEFANVVSREYNRLMHSEHRRISAYNPAANGVAENMVGSMKLVLMKLLSGAVTHWHSYASLVQYALNTRVASVNQSTPFSLLFGRKEAAVEEPEDTSDSDEELERVDSEGEGEAPTSQKALLKRGKLLIDLIYPAVSEVILSKKERMIRSAKKKRRELKEAFALKSKVMLIDAFRTTKSQPRYLGPYTIVGHDVNNGGYRLLGLDNVLVPRTVPANQLKPIKAGIATVDADKEISAHEVEQVVAHKKGHKGEMEYLVKWVDSGEEENSWVPFSNFIDVECVRRYWIFTAPALESSVVKNIPKWARKIVRRTQKELDEGQEPRADAREAEQLEVVEYKIRDRPDERQRDASVGQEASDANRERKIKKRKRHVHWEGEGFVGDIGNEPQVQERAMPNDQSNLRGEAMEESSDPGEFELGRSPKEHRKHVAGSKRKGFPGKERQERPPVKKVKPHFGKEANVDVHDPSEIQRSDKGRWVSQMEPREFILAKRTRGGK